MTKIRNKKVRDQVLIRDLNLCRCCGFRGSQVHHITPIIYGGEDNVTNMVTLCDTCHHHAPNTKEEFIKYFKKGGARTEMMIGKIVEMSFAAENSSNGQLKFQEMFMLGRQMYLCLKQMECTFAIENANLKQSLEVRDIDCA
ncbi:MAG TPA: HNH endonuclease [Candidatus Nanoarchaeia archaeon]|nr:HNH endonuclease [Candidatus Nanoarchaeia archaeon]